MHGREDGQNRRKNRHMWSVASRGLTTTVGVDSCCSSTNSFVKDGRKITVGDCALFKPPNESPPFIGIIHSLTLDTESNLKLGVNWLYRPAEVVLGKGVAVEAAPNEVFYSFHRDETPAASLLHPCKVAFLPKGVELRSGVSSFVCWRVYDIANKCLWWLTDKDYLNDQQEEISKLLQKSRMEMHTTVKKQQGTHSPRLVNGAAAATPLKNSPDSMQSSGGVFSSHLKGKKRDLGDQPSESVKRERLMIADDGDSVLSRSVSVMDAEIAKISEKGELVDYESVERLVQFMQPGTGNSQKKIDLSCRSVLAGIIAGTDKIDCLKWFVQLRGVPVLDEWLQDIHKGKVGDSDGPKDSGKSAEDFLLVLLRALDKLPVNLNALQMCNIGKSVNLLRSHRNSEIQKKARSLVDTWKKRVQAELNSNDAKSPSSQAVSWPTRSRHDLSHGGNKHFGGSSEPSMKNSGQLSCAKPGPVKPAHGDSTPRSINQNASPSRSSTPTNCKEGEARVSLVSGGGSEPLQTSVKEEKSSSSSHSQTNSQCSSEHARNIVPSGKEEVRNSTAKSKSNNRTSGSSRHWKSANGLQGSTQSFVQKESRSSRNTSLSRISPSEKLLHSVMCENAVASPVVDGNSHKMIVKIPTRGQSPAQSANIGHTEESNCRNSRASSPSPSEKHDQADASLREKNNTCQDIEAVLVPSSSDGKQHGTVNGTVKSLEVEKTMCLPTGQAAKTKRSSQSSMSSMNALIESCVKYSEEPASIPVGDDSGMNLLASVAAGEMSTSGVPSPAISPPRSILAVDNTTTDREGGTGCSTGALSGPDVSKDGSQKCGGPPLKRDGDSDDLVASVSVSPACMMRKGDDEHGHTNVHTNATATRDESHDQAPVSKQIANHSLLVRDRVNDESPSAGLDNTKKAMLICPESMKTDEKTSPDPGLNNSTSMENLSPLLVTHSKAFKDEEGQAVDASGVLKVGGSLSHELKGEDARGTEGCSNVPDGGSGRVKEEHDSSSRPVKEEGSSLASTDYDRKIECRANDKQAEAGSPMSSKNSDAVLRERKGECVPSATNSPSVARLSDTDRKPQFDLNEGFCLDDANNEKPMNSATPPFTSSVMLTGAAQSTASTASSGLPASVTVAAAAKRPFVPPEDLLRNKTELGWKGSAATSAFRPAEPRKAFESAVGAAYKAPISDSIASKSARPVLDIDLNVTDEMVLQDMCYQSSGQEIANKPDFKNGGLELDLNRSDEAPEPVHHSASNFQRLELLASPLKPSSTGILNSKLNTERNFDLNDGPAADEPAMEPLACNQISQGILTPQSPFGQKLNNAAVGGLSAWYPPATTFSAVRNPTAVASLPDIPIVGAPGSSRVMAGPATALSFNPDFYRNSVLSSSPAIPYTTAHFQYPVFPYGTGFAPTSSMSVGPATYVDPSSSGRLCPPPFPSQMLGMAANVSTQGLRPFISSNPDASNNGVAESSQRWVGQSLDLNSGPGGTGRDEALIMASRGLPAFNSHAVLEEQARAYHAAGGALKRKEPEGGWDGDRLSYKHSSWQ